jgi:hypothetical protein
MERHVMENKKALGTIRGGMWIRGVAGCYSIQILDFSDKWKVGLIYSSLGGHGRIADWTLAPLEKHRSALAWGATLMTKVLVIAVI